MSRGSAKNIKTQGGRTDRIVNMSDRDEYRLRIAKAVDFIEDRLDREVDAEMVAEHIGFSPYHFHRVFSAVLGESVSGYIRKRRLSEAAECLRQRDVPLFELALRSGFESQEAFTRAFKKMFGVTPGRYRGLGSSATAVEKRRATMEMLVHLQGGITMEPSIITRTAPELAVGLAGSFSPGDTELIGQLWERFVPRMGEVPDQKGTYSLGVCMGPHPDVELKPGTSFVYIAAVPVTNNAKVPEGMVSTTIPAGRYAVFTHRGAIAELPHTINYIWGTWLPQCGYERREGPDFELYDERFDAATVSGEIDIYLPIV